MASYKEITDFLFKIKQKTNFYQITDLYKSEIKNLEKQDCYIKNDIFSIKREFDEAVLDFGEYYSNLEECKIPMIELTDFNSDKYKNLPVSLILGGFHGNEVIGTQTIFRLFQKWITVNDDKNNQNYDYIKNLITTRRVIWIPFINAPGFSTLHREENNIDPNRDFNYDNDINNSFLTNVAKIINYLYEKYVIISCITFHGGDNSITYPFGTYKHPNPKSNDDIGFKKITENLKKISYNKNLNEYITGNMHDIVYDVKGSFEDWSYIGSYEKNYLSKSKFINNSINPKWNKLRSFTLLVECGKEKIPSDTDLGDEESILNFNSNYSESKHISRNSKIILYFISLNKPFVIIKDNKIKIYGCLNLNNLYINGNRVNININNHILYYEIYNVIIKKNILIKFKCHIEKIKNYQSHLMRIISDSKYNPSLNKNEYNINNDDFFIFNKDNISFIKTKILDRFKMLYYNVKYKIINSTFKINTNRIKYIIKKYKNRRILNSVIKKQINKKSYLKFIYKYRYILIMLIIGFIFIIMKIKSWNIQIALK